MSYSEDWASGFECVIWDCHVVLSSVRLGEAVSDACEYSPCASAARGFGAKRHTASRTHSKHLGLPKSLSLTIKSPLLATAVQMRIY